MKKLTIILGLITLILSNIFAQTPEQFKYQAVLRDASGDIIASQAVVVNIKILQTTSTGTEVFTEDHAVTTTAQGLININIGDTEDLSVIDWNADIYFVKITVDGTEMGTSQLLSVPYAMNAKTADNAYWNFNNDEIYYSDNNVAIGTNNAVALLEVGRNDAATNSQVWIDQDGTGDATIGFQTPGQNFSIGIDQSDDNKFKIAPSNSVSSSAIMTMIPTGEVGIGTSSPDYKLHVVDDEKGIFGDIITTAVTSRAVMGRTIGGTSWSYGLYGSSGGAGGGRVGVYGVASDGTTNYAGYFTGNVTVTGNLSKGGGSFKIDHPLDPENKYLYHSFVESPDMMNIYNGNIILDKSGEAEVTMPDWFEVLNMEFRYQLTAIGAPGPNLYIAEEISGNTFKIAGGTTGMKVSWQVTGIRQDPFAEKNRIQVEVDKNSNDKGKYLHPDVYNQPKEKGIDFVHLK